MALTFDDVYRAELAEIRRRRLDQWRVDRIRRDKSVAPAKGAKPAPVEPQQPPADQRDRIVEGAPAPLAPKVGSSLEPPELNRLLEDLESSRTAFLGKPPRTAGKDAKDRHYGLVGLALSGGGVRSSTFCLGAIQALAKWGVFSKVDYLSTVSGGGFIGSSMSSLYADGSTEFPFGHTPGVPEGKPLRHLRNHANYLAPRGLADYLKAPGLLLRGILVNFLIILPYVLVAAMATALYAGPMIREAAEISTRSGTGFVAETVADVWAKTGRDIVLGGSFTATKWLAIAFLALLVIYPIAQSLGNILGWSSWQRRNAGNAILAFGMTLTLGAAAIEAQPIAVYYSALVWSDPRIKGDIISLDVLIGIFSVVAGLGATVSGKLAPKANKLAAKAALYGIGLLGPIVLWLIYLMLTRWAICGPPTWTSAVAEYFDHSPWPVEGQLCFGRLFGGDPDRMTLSVVQAFGVVAAIIWLYGVLCINANRNSLHAYYRDRLSRAYLFKRSRPARAEDDPGNPPARRVVHNDKQLLQELRGRKSAPSLLRRLKAITGKLGGGAWRAVQALFKAPEQSIDAARCVAPYHLINATINVRRPRANLAKDGGRPAHGADEGADMHGRKADFFLFSANHVGSRITTYCRTQDMHDVDHHLDLGTAMAISGAAAAPNMGTSTVRPLVFILTLLNVRLGYWLPNPKDVHRRFHPGDNADTPAAIGIAGGARTAGRRLALAWKALLSTVRLTARVGPVYLLFEMFGLLNQEWPFINVSDGGHIENLGLYPLLQRKCRLIVAIDGERDPASKKKGHRFSALATAIRYARIDHGFDIAIELKDVGTVGGRHFAVGKITYGDDFPHGWLVYIKSSLTDDENPYIREYWLKNRAFPHESTGDQFFDETQFECYRALGYHAVEDFLECPAVEPEPANAEA